MYMHYYVYARLQFAEAHKQWYNYVTTQQIVHVSQSAHTQWQAKQLTHAQSIPPSELSPSRLMAGLVAAFANGSSIFAGHQHDDQPAHTVKSSCTG